MARFGRRTHAVEKAISDLTVVEWEPRAAYRHGEVCRSALGLHHGIRLRTPLQAGQGDVFDAGAVLRSAAVIRDDGRRASGRSRCGKGARVENGVRASSARVRARE